MLVSNFKVMNQTSSHFCLLSLTDSFRLHPPGAADR